MGVPRTGSWCGIVIKAADKGRFHGFVRWHLPLVKYSAMQAEIQGCEF